MERPAGIRQNVNPKAMQCPVRHDQSASAEVASHMPADFAMRPCIGFARSKVAAQSVAKVHWRGFQRIQEQREWVGGRVGQ